MNTKTTNIRNIREFPIANVRNIGIAAHIDAGKTTLTERLLYLTGAIRKYGEVHDGTTTTDFDELERLKGITISAAAVPTTRTETDDPGIEKLFTGIPHRLNIIDTPGHVDFTAEVERSLRVLDGVVTVFDAVAGVQPQSETVWRQADKYRVPRIAFINKMDRAGADFSRVIAEMRNKLGANAWPVLWPIGSHDSLQGQLDIVNEKAILFGAEGSSVYSVEDVPPELRELAASARTDLVTALAEVDDEVANLWLDGRPVPSTVLMRALRRATIASRFVPVIGGSAYKWKGIQPLLDAIVDYLPNPADSPKVEGRDVMNDNEPLAALVFKVVHDGQSGRLAYVRVYTGTLAKGDTILNPRTGKRERVGRLLRIVADRREEMASANAGDIAAIAGLRGFTTGDTVCDPETPLLLEPPVFPEPVVSMAIEPKSSVDRDRLALALARLSDEDPTFRTFTHAETGQTIIAGMGELHLEIVRERLARDHRVQVNTGAPEIAYRETIAADGEADYLLRKQTGGPGQYARVVLRVRPNTSGGGLTIENRVAGGRIPAEFIASVKKGIDEALKDGVLGGYQMVDAQVEIVDGAAHSNDSNEQAFRSAAFFATREALRRAQPLLLEPVMNIEVDTPIEHQGDLFGDIGKRRGKVLGTEPKQNGTLVKAEVPLSELFGYADAIRSLSKGRAAYSMTPARFDPVPTHVAATVLGKRNAG